MKIGEYTLSTQSFGGERNHHLGKYKRDYEKQDKIFRLFGYFWAPDRMKIAAICKKSFVTGLITVKINKACFDRAELDIPIIEAYMKERMADILLTLGI